MGNKKTAYLLLPLVLGLWGFIAYKVYVGLKAEPVYRAAVSQSVEWEQKASAREDYALLLNYKDPFLSGLPEKSMLMQKTSPVLRAGMRQAERKVAEKKPVNWQAFAYLGLMENAQTGEQTALVTFNGQQMLLKAGDLVEGFRVVGVGKDSLRLSFENEMGAVGIN